MKEHQSFDRNEQHNEADDDQLRSPTMNETIREVNGDPDMDLGEIRDNADSVRLHSRTGENYHSEIENTGHISGATGGRNSGSPDLDDQAGGGLETNTLRSDTRQNIVPKTGMTGSDFDGQVSTS